MPRVLRKLNIVSTHTLKIRGPPIDIMVEVSNQHLQPLLITTLIDCKQAVFTIKVNNTIKICTLAIHHIPPATINLKVTTPATI